MRVGWGWIAVCGPSPCRRGGNQGHDGVIQNGEQYDGNAGHGAMSGDAATLWPRVAEGLRRDLGYFAQDWRVYGREGEICACGGTIARLVQSGRSTFHCPKCQR